MSDGALQLHESIEWSCVCVHSSNFGEGFSIFFLLLLFLILWFHDTCFEVI